jgi:hypothetical protein
VKCLSIRQPYAGAVALGWKDVENRGQMFHHRGLLLIHAGGQLAADFTTATTTVEDLSGQTLPQLGSPRESPAWAMGAIVGVVEVSAAHRGCDGSCSPWAQPGRVHHMLTHVGVLRRPVPCPGRLYPWTPEPDVLAEVKAVWPR